MRIQVLAIQLMVLSMSGIGFAQSEVLRGPYLGQAPPGMEPKVFAPGVVSTENVSEFSCTFSADGSEFYFARETGERQFSIFVTRQTGGGWTEPKLASFAGEYFNHEPYISPFSNRIYWGSIRPLPNGKSEYSIWTADREGNRWGTPSPLGFPAMYVTESRDGRLFFTDSGPGGACLARAELREGNYVSELLAAPIQSVFWDGHPCIAPDESFIIFDSENRPESDECGLFISFKNEDGSWTEPANMKSVITKGRFAMLSPDGKYLFFAAPGEGRGKDLFWVDAAVIERFRP